MNILVKCLQKTTCTFVTKLIMYYHVPGSHVTVSSVLETAPGIIAGVGVSSLQLVDMNSSRNICIFGFSLFFGIVLPIWLQESENASKINTGTLQSSLRCVCFRFCMNLYRTFSFSFFPENDRHLHKDEYMGENRSLPHGTK